MPIYQGTAIKNVYDLINRDNPGLPFEVSENTFITGIPKAITRTAQGHDTEVRLVPKNGSQYRGGITITYRRINLAWLFRDCMPQIERFLPTSTWTTLYQLMPLINLVSGMNLAEKDFDNQSAFLNGGMTSPTTKTITARADSLMYTGSFSISWRQGKEELGLDIMTTAELNGVQWPSGNDFVAYPDRKTYQTWLFWDKHFTEEAIAQNWPTAGGGAAWSDNIATYPQLTLWNNALVAQGAEFNYNPYDAVNNPKGLGRTTVYVYCISLPNPAYPEASRQGFSFATVVYPYDPALYAKYGRAIMYFNK